MTSIIVCKDSLRQQLEKSYPNHDLSRWFDPLNIEMDKSGKVLRVSFPHAFFGRWFMDRLQHNFEKHALELFGDIHFFYAGADNKISLPARETVSADAAMHASAFGHALLSSDPDKYSRADERPKIHAEPILTDDQSFDTFLVNRKNEMVLEAARQATAGPFFSCSPFVLYGKSCTGKSHMLNAMTNSLKKQGQNCLFFSNDLHSPQRLLETDFNLFQEEAVFIDDAHRLAGNPSMQDTLASMIDYFRASKKLLAISLDMHPSHCPGINHKLLSRLNSGLVLELKKPDLDIRTQYVEQQNRCRNLELGKDKILAIAQRFADIRLIDGFLTQLAFYRSMRHKRGQGGQDILFPDAAEMLEREEEQKLLTHTGIINTVARYFALSPDDIIGKSRDKKVLQARHIAIMLCRELLGLSLPKVGRLFGNRDHSSVIYSIKRIKQLQESDKVMHSEVEKVRKMCLHGE